jgi:hypothetical protein
MHTCAYIYDSFTLFAKPKRWKKITSAALIIDIRFDYLDATVHFELTGLIIKRIFT